MMRLTTLVAVMFAAGLATLKLTDRSEQGLGDQQTINVFDDKTHEMVLHYGFFKSSFESALRDLGHGRIHLREAVYQVREAGVVYCPIYLNRLAFAEAGATLDERIARNLLGHLRDQETANPRYAGRSTALQVELDAMFPAAN